MRPDGDPEPDDYGLPHVDVVVPDDARELERDVIAYRREIRRIRRRARLLRLLGPLARFGVGVPLLAGAVLVALVSGALMTFFGPRPTPRTAATPTAAPLAPSPSAPPGRIGGWMPDGRIELIEGTVEAADLRGLRPAVFGIAATDCGCAQQIADLSGRAQQYNLRFYLVADTRGRDVPVRQTLKDLQALVRGTHTGAPQLAADRGHLMAAFAPGPGLTAVLVTSDGLVRDIRRHAALDPVLADEIKNLPFR
ncbi:hypothetical protein [Actinomadura macrotermitis]|uniref:hypothetical protein n=1 Tax=Actinomadura macrotermitis TaxID=2585200 RepID=UPI001296658D|nr:hypothetical protein [Actinomadura macrotermitis]